MLDLTKYNIKLNINKPITETEFQEKIDKGLIKNGETVDVIDRYGMIVKTTLCIIDPPGSADTIKQLQKENWQDRRHLRQVCKYDQWVWGYITKNNLIPKDIAIEIENQIKEEKESPKLLKLL